MKKLEILIIIIFILMVPFQNTVEAHSGRTDSSGGHNCSEKSKSKGLCTGYHYHNGGSSTSSNSNSNSSTPVSNDKDCTDFSNYDEVVKYWNAKGYSATYDPENLDGWGNGVVDDGIPCEAPSGYDKTLINKSPEQIQFKQDQNDEKEGNTQGYSKGLKDGYAEVAENSEVLEKSEAFTQGYASGYNKGYTAGKEKIETEKENATKDGYTLGKEQDNLVIPNIYASNENLKALFEEGFNKAITERIEAKKKEYIKLGYEDGKKDIASPPKEIEEIYIESYKDGYEQGQKELRDNYVNDGYEAAFKLINYENPALENEKYINWFKEGYESNTLVDTIEEIAFNQGVEGEEMDVSSEYIKGEAIFTYYYQLGYQEYEKQVEQAQKTAAGGLGTIILAWLGRRFYVVKKMIA
ncbi:YHYH domain-containing protein [Ureibacillus chungkukjangi]|uniref:YHYH domain-containing protein n=1 Tax=Ureibacillus chungkukjangi TaxID=1202712 RepID=UPI00203C87AF|nr:YHYH domain-containing protein [Ureibacillus chungkukjangi]MCM3388190.1 YHYH domain-containing protein [Ureibacillus chungkukjangi]